MIATDDYNVSFDLIITDKDLWDDILETVYVSDTAALCLSFYQA